MATERVKRQPVLPDEVAGFLNGFSLASPKLNLPPEDTVKFLTEYDRANHWHEESAISLLC